MRITKIGHSTFMIEVPGGRTILTDPWFQGGPLRVRGPAIKEEEVTSCDLMLVSHDHFDHFDRPALKLARRLGSTIVAPPGLVRKLTGKGHSLAHSLSAGQTVSLPGDISITGVRAFHPAPFTGEAIGFLIEAGEICLYFAGDTLYDARIVEQLAAPDLDLAFIPIGKVKLGFKKVVMDQYDARELAVKLQPRRVIPMHYGAMRGTMVDPVSFQEALALDNIPVTLLSEGETWEIE